MGAEIAIALLLLVLRNPTATIEAVQALGESIGSWFEDGRDPTPAELGEAARLALDAGADLRSTVLPQLLPGGRWEGQFPAETVELLRIAAGRVGGA